MRIEKGIPQTLGQVAYEAWRDRLDHYRETESWTRLRALEQDMWEDIARAVIDHDARITCVRCEGTSTECEHWAGT